MCGGCGGRSVSMVVQGEGRGVSVGVWGREECVWERGKGEVCGGAGGGRGRSVGMRGEGGRGRCVWEGSGRSLVEA